jgi:hypothetical protein
MKKSSTVKEKKSIPSKKETKRTETIDPAVVIDRLAEEHGISRMDVLRFPKLFKGTGVCAIDVEPSDAMRAEQIHRNGMAHILKKHGALPNFRPAPSLWSAPEAKPKERPQDGTIWGHDAVAVARWMGSEEWPLARASAVLARLGVHFTDGSLRNHLYRGKRTEEGLADLSLQEIRHLAQLAKEIENDE